MSKNEITQISQTDYDAILLQAVAEIRTARTSIAMQINSATNSVYWSLGKLLFEKHLEEGYGSGVVKQLSVDLKLEFPDMGVSPRNLWDMKRFYECYYQVDTKLRRSVAVLPCELGLDCQPFGLRSDKILNITLGSKKKSFQNIFSALKGRNHTAEWVLRFGVSRNEGISRLPTELFHFDSAIYCTI